MDQITYNDNNIEGNNKILFEQFIDDKIMNNNDLDSEIIKEELINKSEEKVKNENQETKKKKMKKTKKKKILKNFFLI